MSEKLTTERLVKLAQLCGKKMGFEDDHPNTPQIRRCDGAHLEFWQPHIDANQRDEVCMALRKRSLYLTLHTMSDEPPWAAYFRDHMKVDHKIVGHCDADTPGLAVCRAALKAIGA